MSEAIGDMWSTASLGCFHKSKPPEGPFPGEVVLLLLHVVHGGSLSLSGLLHELEMESALTYMFLQRITISE